MTEPETEMERLLREAREDYANVGDHPPTETEDRTT